MSAYNLGSDIHTRQMLADALTFQGELFLSTSGASGALSTSLHFLALAMALIGFILILIRPAFQRPSVIGGWLLIFYIMFIGPAKAFNASSSGPDDYDDYNGLLFRAIDSSTDDPMAGRPFYLPQILSIHFVNTIKDGLALALFNSDGSIRDYHQELIKGHKLGALEGVSISDDGSAIAEVASYDRLCGDPRDLIKAPRTGYTEFSIDYDGAASDRTNPQRYTLNRAREDELRTRYFTMEDVFREGENYLYVGGDKAVEGARPPYATLYHTTSQLRANHDLYPEDDERVDRMVELHWLGMNKLLENIMGSGGLSEGSDTNVSESEGNLVMDAVESISGGASVDLSDVEYRWYMGPASAGVYVMETTAEIVGWFRDLLFGTTDSPQFILAPPEGYDDGTVPASLINADDDSLAYNLRRQNFLDFMRDQYSDWETFSSEQAELLQGDEVMAMPVAMTLIRDSIEDEDETVILSSAYTIPPENAGGSELPATNTVRTCLDFHKALRQRILARVGSKIGLSAAVAETLGNADNPTGSAAAEDLIRWFGYAEDDTTVEEIAADEGVDESVATTIRTVGEALESYVALSYLERTGNDLTGSETPDAETYIFVKDYISNYQLNIDINSKALKNKMIEINTIMKFEDKQNNKKKSHFEINYATIIRVGENIKEKKDLEKIILCDVQIEIYPQLEKALLNLLHNSGYQDVKFEKKVDFKKLYDRRLD